MFEAPIGPSLFTRVAIFGKSVDNLFAPFSDLKKILHRFSMQIISVKKTWHHLGISESLPYLGQQLRRGPWVTFGNSAMIHH